MRILFLGNSNESLALAPGTPLRHEILQEELARDFGHVEVITRPAWPNEGFPGVLGRWLAEYEPDLVYLSVAEYWSLYESLPLRIERALPRLGKPIAGAGLQAAGTPWLAHNPVFRRARLLVQSVIPGAVYFTPDEVVSRVLECARVCLRTEGVVLVVDGQRGRRPHAATRRWRDRVEARRLYVHHRLREECARLHVTYGGDDVPQWRTHPEGTAGHRDGLHQGPDGQRWMANEALELIRAALAAEGLKPTGRLSGGSCEAGAGGP